MKDLVSSVIRNVSFPLIRAIVPAHLFNSQPCGCILTIGLSVRCNCRLTRRSSLLPEERDKGPSSPPANAIEVSERKEEKGRERDSEGKRKEKEKGERGGREKEEKLPSGCWAIYIKITMRQLPFPLSSRGKIRGRFQVIHFWEFHSPRKWVLRYYCDGQNQDFFLYYKWNNEFSVSEAERREDVAFYTPRKFAPRQRDRRSAAEGDPTRKLEWIIQGPNFISHRPDKCIFYGWFEKTKGDTYIHDLQLESNFD